MECEKLIEDIIEIIQKIKDEKFLNRIYTSVHDYYYEQKEKPDD